MSVLACEYILNIQEENGERRVTDGRRIQYERQETEKEHYKDTLAGQPMHLG